MNNSTEKNNDAISTGDLAVKGRKVTRDEIYKTYGSDFSPLMHYVIKGDIENVLSEIEENPDTIKDSTRHSSTALSMAAITGPIRVDIAEILLDNGADINTENSGGWSPLMEACGRCIFFEGNNFDVEQPFFDKIPIVELFLDRGADINHLGENHQTAIMIAAQNENTELVEFLASRGADINVKDRSGYTATMIESRYGKKNTVQALISNGADINTIDTEGKNATILAFEGENFEIVEVLDKWPATMAIIVLQELRCNDCGDMTNFYDLIEFLGYQSNYIDFFEDEEVEGGEEVEDV